MISDEDSLPVVVVVGGDIRNARGEGRKRVICLSEMFQCLG